MGRVKQQGFTLIELVVVIVILGILAATAIPKFVSLQGEAGDASAQATAAAISSGASINYAKYLAAGNTGTAVTTTTTCANLLTNFIAGGAMPDTNLSWVSGTATLAGCGASGNLDTTCKVKHANGATSAGFAVKTACTG